MSNEHQPEISLLKEGVITNYRLIPYGSNHTFLVDINSSSDNILAIYKPARGESPLWDFPPETLYKREMASFVVSSFVGWPLVPITVVREAEYGIGTLQVFVHAVSNENYFSLRSSRKPELCKIFAFDCLINNADRKGGHCILDKLGRVWSIDHGLTFHHFPKIRTVIWDFVRQYIPNHIVSDMSRLLGELSKIRDNYVYL